MGFPQFERPVLQLWSLYNGRIRRGKHVADDRVTEAAMEDRKRKGYF